MVWCGVVWRSGAAWFGLLWCGVVWCGVVWCGEEWCGVVRCEAVAQQIMEAKSFGVFFVAAGGRRGTIIII